MPRINLKQIGQSSATANQIAAYNSTSGLWEARNLLNVPGTAVAGGSTYNVVATDLRLDCATSGGAISVVLPTAASSTNRELQIIDAAGSAQTNNITVTVSGGGTINGSASYVVNLNYGAVTFACTGSAWRVLDKVEAPTPTAGTSGYVLTSQGTAGPPQWSAAGGGGGGYATGVRQIVTSFVSGVSSTSTILPADNSIPQSTEGAQFLSATITPQSATSSLFVYSFCGALTNSASGAITSALFRDSASNAFAASVLGNYTAGTSVSMSCCAVVSSSSTSSTTFRVRVGLSGAGTLVFNGYAGPTQLYGGVCSSGITIIEFGA